MEKNSAELAVERSKRWLDTAREALKGERYDDAVYCAQMGAEHAAKAVLISHGIEYPKKHDVSDLLKMISSYPEWFSGRLDRICRIITELAEWRGLAGYGFERGLDASTFKEDAPEACDRAEFVIDNCEKLISESGETIEN